MLHVPKNEIGLSSRAGDAAFQPYRDSDSRVLEKERARGALAYDITRSGKQHQTQIRRQKQAFFALFFAQRHIPSAPKLEEVQFYV